MKHSSMNIQAKPCHVIPSNIIHIPPPQIKLLPSICRIPAPDRSTTPPRAISISDPENSHIGHINHVPVHATPEESDDFIAAFWDYQFLFVSQRTETTERITLRVVDGVIPPDFPSGTYYLTGPGLFTDDHGSTVHPLDGHGYLRAFYIDGVTREVKFMAKYVKTEAQVEEHDPKNDTWRFTHRGPFSVLKGGKKFGNTKVMKNVANTSVLKWGGKLLCFWEGGDPYEIESRSLNTIGKFDVINGHDYLTENSKVNGDVQGDVLLDMATKVLKPILYGVFTMPPKRLLAHYKLDVKRNRLLTVSCNAEDMLLPRSTFTFYEYDSNFKLLQKQEFNIPDHLMIHDWAFTDNYYILFANRIKLDAIGSMMAVCGITPMISALTVNPNKSTSPIYVLPRFTSNNAGEQTMINRDWRVPLQAPSQLWILHVGNAFELEDDFGSSQIQVHAIGCSYHWFNFQRLFGYNWQSGKLDPSTMNIDEPEKQLLPHLVQVKVNVQGNGSSEGCNANVEAFNQWRKATDFPIINPKYSGLQNNYIYAATSTGSRQALPHFPFDTVVKFNMPTKSTTTWSVGSRKFIGEPIFVPKRFGDEDDGYLLVVEYAVAIQRCYLVILDAKKIGEADALVARLEVPKHLNFPLGFHGFWAEGVALN